MKKTIHILIFLLCLVSPFSTKSSCIRLVENLYTCKDVDQVIRSMEGSDTVAQHYSGEKYFLTDLEKIVGSGFTDDQKLLLCREFMQNISEEIERITIIKSIENIKTFKSLIYLKEFLNDDRLKVQVARSIIAIALSGQDEWNEFNGQIVKDMLKKSVYILKGQMAKSEHKNVKGFLRQMPIENGFIPMFNGENLEGWQGFVANPLEKALMDKKELKLKQTEADKKMHENWRAEDGMIVYRELGANLVSTKEYGNFEMIVDWKITKEGDSGIYLRGVPQVQIWDTSRVKSGAHVGSGGLYNNKINERIPLKVADNPVGEWNTFRIKIVDDKVTVFLNGVLVTDNVTMENFWDRNMPLIKKGPVELQAYHSYLAFRDIYIREINATGK